MTTPFKVFPYILMSVVFIIRAAIYFFVDHRTSAAIICLVSSIFFCVIAIYILIRERQSASDSNTSRRK